ncbi:metal-dependent hydrolase [Cellulophaga baltica]|uniref:metal-dependent hydrolase n=1 Tax=Cellulophaga TaxID=104264 RepID=UPI001C07E2DD|nr:MULTISPECIES: metal-dependent hydrolase [Cellulophaga]MBU2995235.1 metal-dependent hydrolase [Cellulophaga baltica]MDO6766630.1 metal-dependent hydrolase [Cellulophaga sp. 1_MG-2023]
MDSLTQIVLGAAVGEVVLGKKVGNKAMLFGAIAGTIPDLDVFTKYFTDDPVSAIEMHRGFSHSILFSVLFAPIFGWLIYKLLPKAGANWKEWSCLMFWGLFTHPILDSFTTWGTQLFWPFKMRLAFMNIFVIDPLYTIPFMVFLILAMCQKRTSKKRKKYNRLGLIVSTSYMVLSLFLKFITYQKFTNALEEQGIDYLQIDTRPSAFNTILWTANIETENSYLIANYSFFDSQPIYFENYPKNRALLGELSDNKNIKRLIAICEGWYIISEKNGELYFNDLRFGLMSFDKTESRFAFSYLLKQNGSTLEIEETPKDSKDAKKLLAGLWNRIWGN